MDRPEWSRRTVLYGLLGAVGVATLRNYLFDRDDVGTNVDRVGYGTVGYGTVGYGANEHGDSAE